MVAVKEKLEKTGKESSVKMPKHVAIIMDGNRRWAEARGKDSSRGHLEGYRRLREIGQYCKKIGIDIITVYALSSENLKGRSEKELNGLFDVVRIGIKRETKRVIRDNIRFVFIGREKGLPDDILNDLRALEEKTKGNKEGIFNVAINYGGRSEIVDAIKNIVSKKIAPEEITEKVVSDHLYTCGQDEPELVIRTGGRTRTSNFLPWQATYAEYFFTEKLWPEFTLAEFDKSIEHFVKAQRNFGK